MGDSERAQLSGELFAFGRGVGAEAFPQLPAAGIDTELLARLRVDEPEVADVRSSCSRGSRISIATTSWRDASWSRRGRQSRGPRKSETTTITARRRATVYAIYSFGTCLTRTIADGRWVAQTADHILAVVEASRADVAGVARPGRSTTAGPHQWRRRPRTDAAALVDLLVDEVLDRRSVALAPPHDDIEEPEVLRRVDGSSVYTVAGAALYTSQRILDAEQRLLTAAARRDGSAIKALSCYVLYWFSYICLLRQCLIIVVAGIAARSSQYRRDSSESNWSAFSSSTRQRMPYPMS